MNAPQFPATLEPATWASQMGPHKAVLAKARIKVPLDETLKALQRTHRTVDWGLLAADDLATAESAAQRQAALEAARSGPIKALLKLAEQARAEAKPLIAGFKAEPALKNDVAKLVSEIAASAASYARTVGETVEAAVKAVEKRRLTLAAAAKAAGPAKGAAGAEKAGAGGASAVDPKLAAAVRARLVSGLKAVRKAAPGQPPMKFVAAVAALRARLVIGPSVGNAQKTQLLALLPGVDGIKWMKGECVWENKAVTFICDSPPSGAGKRLQIGLLEQTKAKLRVRVRKPDAAAGDVETCDGDDDPGALQESDAQAEGATEAAQELKSRRLVEESALRVRIESLLPAFGQLKDEAQRRDHAARLVTLRQALAKLGGLTDAAALKAIEAMMAKASAQKVQLDAARQAATGGKSGKTGPRPRDLSDPEFARAVLASLTPQERAALKTRADYQAAVDKYNTQQYIDGVLGPKAEKMVLDTTLTVGKDQLRDAIAGYQADRSAERSLLRQAWTARGLDPKEVDKFDDDRLAAEAWKIREAARLEASPLANDGLGDSKGGVNHFLDGVEHGLLKVAHDVGNLALAGKFIYDRNTGKATLEEPMWFGAAGRTRGQNQSWAGLGWELAGNVTFIGRAQLLLGMKDMAVGAYKGDWNGFAYGVGNMFGAAMSGAVMDRLPLQKGTFADTRIGKVVEAGKNKLAESRVGKGFVAGKNKLADTFTGKPADADKPRTAPGRHLPNDDGMHGPKDVPTPLREPHARETSTGLRVEIEPHLVGSNRKLKPNVVQAMNQAVDSVEGVLPKGRKIATPEGKPLSIVFDPAEQVPHMHRPSGTVFMNPDLDARPPFPKTGTAAEMARWAPKAGDPQASKVVMQHELGHAAMPEIGARLEKLSQTRAERAMRKLFGLSKSPEEKLKDARIERENLLVQGLDELGADTIAVAAAKDLQAMPKSIAHGMAQVLDAKAKNPDLPLPAEFPKQNPTEWMRRRDFSDGGTIPKVGDEIGPYDVFCGVRRHLGQQYGKALTGKDAPKVTGALMAANEQFMKKIDADPALLDGDFVAANKLFVELFDAEAAKLGLKPQAAKAAAPR